MADDLDGDDWVNGTPPVEGLAELFEQLDRIARRRPRGNPQLPSLLFRGRDADAVVTGYRERLIIRGRETVPHVRHDCSEAASPETEPDFLDGLANGLCRAMPGGMRGMRGPSDLRLPRYWQLRQVLDATVTADAVARQRKTLRDALYARRGELGAPVGWLDSVVRFLSSIGIGDINLGVIAQPSVALSKLLFGWRLRLGKRFRWFSREVADVTGVRRDFLDAALCLVHDGSERSNDTLVRQVLTLALLRDLQAATRWSLSPFRRRRVTPFILHLTHVAPRSSGYRLLETLGIIDRQALRRQTILVLASLAPEVTEPPAPPDTPVCSPANAAERLRALANGEATAGRALLVDIPADAVSSQDRKWLKLHQKVQPMPVAGSVAVPVVACLIPVMGIGWLVGDRVTDDPRCPYFDKRSGEVIGVGDGTTGCRFFEEPSGPQLSIYADLRAVEDTIAEENKQTLKQAENQDHPYRTIVFFSPLTVPPGAGRQGENALNQLRGIALAQERANDLVQANPDRVLTRVLLANPGDRFAYGEEAAEQITDLAREDDTIIGVVGISQSRGHSRAALAHLGSHGLPVVAGPVTGDRMIDSSPHYYQVSPRNMRVAAALVAFSTNTEIVRNGGQPARPNGAVIVMDHSDEYAQNLADDLYDQFVAATGRDEVDMISHPVEDTSLEIPDPEPDEPTPSEAGSLDELAHQVCAAMDERDVLFYASRSQQFKGMLDSMHNDEDCPDEFTIVGGSALTKIVEDPSSSLSDYTGMDLYYAGFASRDGEFNRTTRRFLELYDRKYGPDSGIHDAALAYDAFDALQWTANYARRNRFPISAATSASTLSSDEVEFDGASGYIALGNDPLAGESPRVPPDKAVLVLRAHGADVMLDCGYHGSGNNQDTWGPDDLPCPSPD